jgi:hypothetical protein
MKALKPLIYLPSAHKVLLPIGQLHAHSEGSVQSAGEEDTGMGTDHHSENPMIRHWQCSFLMV